MNKKRLIFPFTLIAVFGVVFGVTYAAFMDKGEVMGSRITVGSSDIKLFASVSQDLSPENLVDSLNGPTFENISQNWEDTYLVKIFNNTQAPIALSSIANYETINDLSDLRGDVNIEIFDWYDTNYNGIVDESEVGDTYGKKTIIKWKTEGFDLLGIEGGEVKGLILKFSTLNLSDTKQGAEMVFDFEFNATSLE